MAREPMPDWECYEQGSVLVIKPEGRLDHGMSENFENALENEVRTAISRTRHLVVDLANVNFVSSIILKAIRNQKEALAKHDLRLALCRPSPVVREILQIAQFHFVAGCHDSVISAEAALSGS